MLWSGWAYWSWVKTASCLTQQGGIAYHTVKSSRPGHWRFSGIASLSQMKLSLLCVLAQGFHLMLLSSFCKLPCFAKLKTTFIAKLLAYYLAHSLTYKKQAQLWTQVGSRGMPLWEDCSLVDVSMCDGYFISCKRS